MTSMTRLRNLTSVVTLLVSLGVPVAGQAPASVPLSRTPDGKPDLSGFWQVSNTAVWDIQDHRAQKGAPAGQGVVEGNEVPYQPWARARREALSKAHTEPTWEQLDPQAKCYPDGVPRINYQSEWQIIQPPGYVVFLYSFTHEYRVVPIDGRPHVGKGISYWMGDNRGHWEGTTLVIDVTNNNDKFWFDVVGDFHSPALHMVERYTFVSTNQIKYEITVEDSNVYTRPWKMGLNIERNKEPGYYLLEEACYEGNSRNLRLMVKDSEPKAQK